MKAKDCGRLVLGRNEGQAFQIGEATVRIIKVKGSNVKLAIDAPKSIPIKRSELPTRGVGGM